jgi:hypothetical protein
VPLPATRRGSRVAAHAELLDELQFRLTWRVIVGRLKLPEAIRSGRPPRPRGARPLVSWLPGLSGLAYGHGGLSIRAV